MTRQQWRALSLATASDDIVRGMTERPPGAKESVGEACGCGAALLPGGMNGRGTVDGSARALFERSENIPHRTSERAEGVQLSGTLTVTEPTSFHT